MAAQNTVRPEFTEHRAYRTVPVQGHGEKLQGNRGGGVRAGLWRSQIQRLIFYIGQKAGFQYTSTNNYAHS